MKILLKSVCVAFVVIFIFALLPFEGECRSISDKVLRVHIIANSDSKEDQELKLKVRDAILEASEDLFSSVHSKEQAQRTAEANLDLFADVAYDTVLKNGFNYSVSARVADVCFDTRYYDDFTMPGGTYDALQIKIGDAKGKNWWCVMYPSLCIPSATGKDALKENFTDAEYDIISSDNKYVFRFKVVEMFTLLISLFSQ